MLCNTCSTNNGFYKYKDLSFKIKSSFYSVSPVAYSAWLIAFHLDLITSSILKATTGGL